MLKIHPQAHKQQGYSNQQVYCFIQHGEKPDKIEQGLEQIRPYLFRKDADNLTGSHLQHYEKNPEDYGRIDAAFDKLAVSFLSKHVQDVLQWLLIVMVTQGWLVLYYYNVNYFM